MPKSQQPAFLKVNHQGAVDYRAAWWADWLQSWNRKPTRETRRQQADKRLSIR